MPDNKPSSVSRIRRFIFVSGDFVREVKPPYRSRFAARIESVYIQKPTDIIGYFELNFRSCKDA